MLLRSPSIRPASTLAAGALITLAWLMSGVALLAGLGDHPVTRSQEARVLVTARDMLGQPLDRWLIPHTNGRVRLRKPPLAYWLSAGAFALFGVSEWAGRAPMVIAAWLTIGLTFVAGRHQVGSRAGLLAAAFLASSAGFAHYARLAETDVLVALFVTAAAYAILRAFEIDDATAANAGAGPRWRQAGWFHLSSAAIALAILAKGPPAAYPMLLLAGLAAVERRWGVWWRWVRCGAPVMILLLAAPWFAYMLSHADAAQAVADFRNSASGGGHRGWFFVYIPQLLAALLPWSALAILALIVGLRRARSDQRVRAILLWIGAIFVPLCLWGAKQPHYLLPLLPPVALLVGWLCDTITGAAREQGVEIWLRRVAVLTIVLLALGAAVLPSWAWSQRGAIVPIDIFVAVELLALCIGVLAMMHVLGVPTALLATAIGVALLCVPTMSFWLPTLERSSVRAVARDIREQYGPRQYVYYRGGENLPLCFYLPGRVPRVINEVALQRALKRDPDVLVIQALADDDPPDPPPPPFREVQTYRLNGRVYTIYTIHALLLRGGAKVLQFGQPMRSSSCRSSDVQTWTPERPDQSAGRSVQRGVEDLVGLEVDFVSAVVLRAPAPAGRTMAGRPFLIPPSSGYMCRFSRSHTWIIALR